MLPWLICGVLVVIIIVLVVKIKIMQRSMDEICACLLEHLSSDTNQLITVSSSDKYVRQLASEISKHLTELRRQRHQYINGDRELKEAVTNISHDLRTPLTAILGYLDLLKDENKSEQVARYLGYIGERANTLKILTEELFRYSVIISTKNEMQFESVCVNSVLENSIASFYYELTARNIVPNVEITNKRITRRLNSEALSRLFGNIIDNATKYSDGDLNIILSDDGEIIFSNTASSLDEVQVGKLFDRFYTLEIARKSTGLGLAIAKSLVEQMNGEIKAIYTNSKLNIIISFSENL